MSPPPVQEPEAIIKAETIATTQKEEAARLEERKAIIISLSGCSSSGKTTLARLLRDIFPRTYILHEDDFYREERELPMRDGLLDWDCAEALNLDDMLDALRHIRRGGTFPPTLASKEDQNSIGPCPVSSSTITSLKSLVKTWSSTSSPSSSPPLKIFILDGFLLYSRTIPTSIRSLLDIKFFLRVSHAQAKARREARTGYVTLEGFWADPPGYVDQIVWPNYVRDHEWLFEGGDVEGRVEGEVVRQEGILCFGDGEGEGEGRKLDVDMEVVLRWIVGVLMEELPKFGEVRGGVNE